MQLIMCLLAYWHYKGKIQEAGTRKKSQIWEAGTPKMSWIANKKLLSLFVKLLAFCSL